MRQRARLGVLLALLAVTSPGWASCLTTPAPSNLITSDYGWRFHPVFHRWRLHRGADFRAQLDGNGVGTTLIAAESGTAQVTASASGGNELRIVGSDGTIARYLHLTRALVKPGDSVQAGQNVAISGGTGSASAAPHLHFEVYEKGKHDVNPESMLCNAAGHKSDAGESDGFPVLACNPDGGQQCVGSPPPAAKPGSGPATGPATGGTPAVAADNSSPPAPTTAAWDDLSTIEVLTTEVYKRFANPDWYRETAERGAAPLVKDYLQMQALDNDIALRRKAAQERTAQLWAVKAARDVRHDLRIRLDRQRTVVDRSSAQP